MENSQNNNSVTVAIQPDPADVSKNKVFAVLSYFGILFILPLLCCKDSAYAKFHANQGLLIFILELVVGILRAIFGAIGGVFAVVGGIVTGLISLLTLVFFILGLVSAAQGTMKPLPLIGSIRIIK